VQTSDFNYHLPESSIAQTPSEPRDSSRLLVLHRRSGDLEHRLFREIGAYLHPDDLLVLNQTRVIPARILRASRPAAAWNCFLLRRLDELTWQVPGRWKRPAPRHEGRRRIPFWDRNWCGNYRSAQWFRAAHSLC